MTTLQKTIPLLLSIIFFIGFGLYHITKFETVDEHFWKYDRIKKYYAGIEAGFSSNNWQKTRINDKPGVTVALISGLGLPFIPNPHAHEDLKRESNYIFPTQKNSSDKIRKRKMYVLYDTTKTASINLGLRLPILLFNGLIMLPLLFWILRKAFNWKIASLSIFLIGLNPILIGMSQIPNPDSLLWSFSAAAIFSFIALLKTEEKKFIVLTGILTGFALLSKYTANLLFIFYPLLFILYQSISTKTNNNPSPATQQFTKTKKYLTTILTNRFPKLYKKYNPLKKPLFDTFLKYFIAFSLITLISWVIVIILMPAVIQAPRHFLYATVLSPVLEPINIILIKLFHIKKYFVLLNGKYLTFRIGIFSMTLFSLITLILPPLFILLFKKFNKFFISILRTLSLFFILMFLLTMLNAWFNTFIFDLENIKEISRRSGAAVFPQFKNDFILLFYAKAFLVQAQNFIFSLHPIVIFSTLLASILLILDKIRTNAWVVYFFIITPFVFFFGAILSEVFVNVRYSIMLYPLFALFSSIGILEIIKYTSSKNLKKYTYNKLFIFFSIVILLTHIFSLVNIKPFFFNYTNTLLPKKYVVTDAWGYGFYEAAEFLNNLPDAKNTVVWLDRSGVCQFFVGKCIASREIYLDNVSVDYLVLTRRGSIIKRPKIISSKKPHQFTNTDYYSEESLANPIWKIDIDNRPGNFVKIIKVKK